MHPDTLTPGRSAAAPDAPRAGRRAGTALGIALGVVVFQALLFTLFAWPALHSAPRDLPVVVAGPPAATAPVASMLTSAKPGAFDVTRMTDPAAADQRLRDRTAYGVFVVGPTGMRLHVASAASPQIAEILRQVAQSAGAARGTPIPVTDVVPTDRDDPNGVVLAIGVLPLVITSLIAGALLGLIATGRLWRLVGVVTYAALAGLGSVAVAKYWLSALPGHYLLDAGAVALLAAGVAGVITGLAGLLRAPGVALGALVMFACGIPLAGLTASPALLPSGWGTVGQYLPPGAGGTLLRSVSFFDGAGIGTALPVLVGWAALGLVLIALGRRAPAAH